MPETHIITAQENDAGERIDRFLAARLPGMSRSRIQALIEQNHITCRGESVAASGKVKSGQIYKIAVPDIQPSYMVAQAIALDIVYEDEHILILNKPAGLTVHPGAGNPDMTLANALLAHCGESLSGIGGVARPGIVHRIDKDTSGLLAVAKNDAAHHALSEQLAKRTLKRTYLALVWGAPKHKTGTVTGNIGRSPVNRKKMAVTKTGGKPAVTHYSVVDSKWWMVNSKKNYQPPATIHHPLFSLLECQLETGRTHQIRVHLSHIGHALVGDPVYGGSTAQHLNAKIYKTLPEKTREALLAFRRQALHAKELVLVHPATGKSMRFEGEMPQDMKQLIEAL